MRDVLTAMIKAHEIQGCIALENSFNKVGLDHVVLVKVATTAVVSKLLGSRATRPSPHSPSRGLMARACARIVTRPTPARAKLGRGRCNQPRSATGADGTHWRDGLPLSPNSKDMGFYDVLFKGREFNSSGHTAPT